MFVATSFPCEAWLSVLDSNALEILVMPLEITGVDDDPEFYLCSDTDAPIHRDFLCLSQAEAIQRLSDLIAQIVADPQHPIHYMSGGLVEAKASLDTLLAIQKAKATK